MFYCPFIASVLSEMVELPLTCCDGQGAALGIPAALGVRVKCSINSQGGPCTYKTTINFSIHNASRFFCNQDFMVAPSPVSPLSELNLRIS